MPKLTEPAVVAVTPAGLKTALRLRELFLRADLFCPESLKGEPEARRNEQIFFFQESLPRFTGSIFSSYKALIFVTAVGIAVRSIAPYLRDKKKDPAVVAVDDTAFFVVSLLSGHSGGANDLAAEIAAYLGAIPVITTSTDRHNLLAFDLLARRRSWLLEHGEDLKKISAAQVKGKELLLYLEENIAASLPGNYAVARSAGEFYRLLGFSGEETPPEAAASPRCRADLSPAGERWQGVVLMGSSLSLPAVPEGLPYIILRPRSITAGIGCRRGVKAEEILQALENAFSRCGRRPESLKSMATISAKEEEEGLLEAARALGVPLHFFAPEQIRRVEHLFGASAFVEKRVGVGSVAEPCAYLGSAGGKLILKKTVYPGITVALGEASLRLF